MKYRVKIDLSFDSSTGQAEAQALMAYARALADRAVSINEGQPNEELSFCEMELCRHDEGLPCTRLERLEVKIAGGEQT